MTATVKAYRYVNGTPGTMKQGVKGNHTPHGAVAGGNGSFIIRGESPKVIIGVLDKNGNSHEINIYYDIKGASDHRMSKKYAMDICSHMMNQEIELEENAYGGYSVSNVAKYIY